MLKTVIEETREICTLCGGRGQEQSYSNTSGMQGCRACHGSGQVLTKTVTRHEEMNLDELSAALALRLAQQVKR